MQKALIIIGVTLLILGLAWPWISKLPLGRLPGDIVIERENFRLYFIAAIILSVIPVLALRLDRFP